LQDIDMKSYFISFCHDGIDIPGCLTISQSRF
jgi:hypothetical protein